VNGRLTLSRRRGAAGSARGQRGVALAIVVWFVAGMSLLVSGIVGHARMDAKMAQAHVARAKAVAAGDGAIRLMLAEQRAGLLTPSTGAGAYDGNYRLGDSVVRVVLYPVSGLLDLNTASHEELSALFSVAAGLDTADADALAAGVVEWRQPGTAGNNQNNRRNRFTNIEDLLRVDGMGRTQLDAIRDYIAAGAAASGRINWTLAPPALMPVLERLDPRRAANVMERRDAMAEQSAGGQQSAGGPQRAGGGDAGSWRADALVSHGGRQWLRRRWITPGEDTVSGLPWRVVRTEPPRVVAAAAAGTGTGRG
jgi:DNA uptake protein ComE-like DNA-binding protein